METSTTTNWVSCDSLGGYDWSDQEEEGPNYAFMAFLSSNSNLEVSNDSTCLKFCLETVKLLKSQNDQLLKDLKKLELMVLVPPPYIGNFMPPTLDLSFTGLDKFVNKLVVENCKAKFSVEEPKGNPQMDLQDQGVIDSGYLRNMIGNMSYLIDYKEIDGGYVAFGGNPKGGKITRKYTIKTEEVNTACYVQNRVLVVKPHNKTPYELFHARTPTLCFIRPFSKAFRVFNSRTRIVEENLHIKFSESTPDGVGSGPDWLFDIDALTRTMIYEPIITGTQSNCFASTKANDNASQARKETELVKNYILLLLFIANPPFSQDPKSSHDYGSKPSSDDGKKVDKDPKKENECNDQEKKDNVNNTNNVNTVSLTINTAGTNGVNAIGENISIKLQFHLNLPALKDVSTFDFSSDDEDDGAVADINNLDTTIQKRAIGPKWIFKNKKDERGIMIKNKARLVVQGYTFEDFRTELVEGKENRAGPKDYKEAKENGNSFMLVAQTTTNADGTSTTLRPGPVNTKEKAKKKNDVKARSMLLMALPNEHLITFNQYKDAKTLFVAIQTRFGGNEATNKTQKTLMKQMYENFSALSTKSLDSIFNRIQKINMDFVSSPSSTNEVNTAYGVNTANTQVSPASTKVSTASTQDSTSNLSDATIYAFLASQPNRSQLVHNDLVQIHEDDLKKMDLKWQLALLSIRTRKFFQKTGKKITINRSDTTGYDKSKVECFNYNKLGHFARECRQPRNQDSKNRNQDNPRRTVNVEETASNAMVAIDGAGFDWRYMADDEVPTNMALMALLDSEVLNEKTCSKTCLKSFETLKTQLDDLRIKFNKSEFNLTTYKRGLASVEEQLVFYKKNDVIFYEQIAVLKRDISYKDSEISMLKSELEKLKQEKESNQLKIKKFDNASKSLDKLLESQIPDNSRKGVGFVSYNVVPPPPTGLFSPLKLDLSNFGLKEFQQLSLKELVLDDKLKKKTVFPTVTKIEFIRPKQQEKLVRKPVKVIYKKKIMAMLTVDAQGTRLRTCSISLTLRNLMEDMLHLEEEPKEEKLLICNKKNSVLFTDTGCFVLSLNFKLIDESQVLLKLPRKNNMYNIDMKNIVPKDSLTCLVAKATLDESMLWHRRLDHLGKFDGKSDDGFFVRYSLNSDGPKWLLNINALTKSMNYVPVVAGTNSNDFVGTEESIGVGHTSKETGSSKHYILMALWKDGLLFDSFSKSANNDEPQPSSDVGKKDDNGVTKESRIDDQERLKNSTQDVNNVRLSINTVSTNVNTGSLNINIISPSVTTAPLKATHADLFGDEIEVDISKISTTYLAPSTLNTRIHKDHSLDHEQIDFLAIQEATVAANSTTIAEYVAATRNYGQTATVRTVDNEEQEITAIVDGKEFIVTEESIRRHLQLADADGVHTPRSDEERFKQHELTGNVQQQSNDPPLLRGHTLRSDLVITILKLRVKKLEKKKKKARTPQPLKRRLFKVRVESSAEENLNEEDLSKQGRSFNKVQVTPTQFSAQGEAHSQEDQLGVLSATKRKSIRVSSWKFTRNNYYFAKVGSSKRGAEAELDHEDSKRQKTNEASGLVQKQPDEEENELSEEDLKQKMMVVPVEEFYVEALHVKC
nr:ribonuclease H-like domain-containing protein [Tanacetum cinerariifolium]